MPPVQCKMTQHTTSLPWLRPVNITPTKVGASGKPAARPTHCKKQEGPDEGALDLSQGRQDRTLMSLKAVTNPQRRVMASATLPPG